MTIEGMWCAVLVSPQAGILGGGGTVMLRGGYLLGGDEQYLWRGSYAISPSGLVNAKANVRLRSGDSNSIFGSFGNPKLLEFVVDLAGGEKEAGVIRLEGQINGHEEMTVVMRLTR